MISIVVSRIISSCPERRSFWATVTLVETSDVSIELFRTSQNPAASQTALTAGRATRRAESSEQQRGRPNQGRPPRNISSFLRASRRVRIRRATRRVAREAERLHDAIGHGPREQVQLRVRRAREGRWRKATSQLRDTAKIVEPAFARTEVGRYTGGPLPRWRSVARACSDVDSAAPR